MEYTLNQYIAVLQGNAFIKETKKIGNNLVVTYYSTFDEFITDNQDSSFTREEFDNYFLTGDKIKKIIVGEPVRILREFPEIYAVTLNINEYHTHVYRTKLFKYLGFDVSELSVEDGSWNEKFANKYIGDKEGREKFFIDFICNQKY
ncbi:hypothetical protein [Peribacillus frigoritolerans]|uniref:hypothetical protein n=1 Tax=Peribacillus frigoritolerans TaxID=450367 RepID=UPI0010594684|nr:hypothetical protein [Peribacillus frigoritolerans]TDL76162.1 hypothetical protein E2R53_20940 [Peribacillus frigoritolerans]